MRVLFPGASLGGRGRAVKRGYGGPGSGKSRWGREDGGGREALGSGEGVGEGREGKKDGDTAESSS